MFDTRAGSGSDSWAEEEQSSVCRQQLVLPNAFKEMQLTVLFQFHFHNPSPAEAGKEKLFLQCSW